MRIKHIPFFLLMDRSNNFPYYTFYGDKHREIRPNIRNKYNKEGNLGPMN